MPRPMAGAEQRGVDEGTQSVVVGGQFVVVQFLFASQRSRALANVC